MELKVAYCMLRTISKSVTLKDGEPNPCFGKYYCDYECSCCGWNSAIHELRVRTLHEHGVNSLKGDKHGGN